jgi:hypothetical protein
MLRLRGKTLFPARRVLVTAVISGKFRYNRRGVTKVDPIIVSVQ